MPLLAAVGVGVIVLGAIVLLLMPDRPGGTISWAGANVNSAGAGLPLIVLGVVAVAVGVARGGDGRSTTSSTTQAATLVEEPFSAPTGRRWTVESAGGTESAHVSNGAFQVSLSRGMVGASVRATPRTAPSGESVRVEVEAHRYGGTATEDYGYGLFCRSNGAGDLYTFTLWAHHAVIEKRSGGQVQAFGPNANVTAQGDETRTLEAVCTTIDGGRGVDLQFLVNGKQVVSGQDLTDPLTTGAFGLRAVFPKRGGSEGDTFEVEFDNFKVVGE